MCWMSFWWLAVYLGAFCRVNYAESCSVEFHSDECHSAECHFDEYYYSECHSDEYNDAIFDAIDQETYFDKTTPWLKVKTAKQSFV